MNNYDLPNQFESFGYARKQGFIAVKTLTVCVPYVYHFCETEIIGLLASQKDPSQIMAGVLQAIAQKIQQMAGKIDFQGNKPLLMTGGLSKSAVLANIIAQNIGHKVITHQLPVRPSHKRASLSL